MRPSPVLRQIHDDQARRISERRIAAKKLRDKAERALADIDRILSDAPPELDPQPQDTPEDDEDDDDKNDPEDEKMIWMDADEQLGDGTTWLSHLFEKKDGDVPETPAAIPPGNTVDDAPAALQHGNTVDDTPAALQPGNAIDDTPEKVYGAAADSQQAGNATQTSKPSPAPVV